MRMPNDAHTKHPWRVHELARDFELLDVWRYPVEIGPDFALADFADFIRAQEEALVRGNSAAALLFKLRMRLGAWFGWDDEPAHATATAKASLPSVRDRLTAEDHAKMRPGALEEPNAMGPGFQPVYVFEDEILLEIQNATVHALMHLGRVAIDARHWSPQMAVYVITKGRLGSVYMTLITPFRHGIVYPAMMRAAKRGWPTWAAQRAAEQQRGDAS